MADLPLDTLPNHLLAPVPYRAQPAKAWRTALWLTLAALVPRLLMALHLPTLCVDGAGYVATAAALDRGEQGLVGPLYHLNTYPIVLAGLHQLGLPWEHAGKFWGVLCGTLVVPALFGWVRREFNDRTAVAACLLYAAHPELIEWSPETVRDPTFWLLFTGTIYLLWRAVVEVRLRHFVAVGILLPLCVLTRFEGAFLLLPLIGWSLVRFSALRASRGKLAAGLAVSLLIAPAALVVVNLAWLKHDSAAELLYVEPLKRLASLTASLTADDPADAAGVEAAVRPSPLAPVVIGKTLLTIDRGLTTIFAVSLLAGLYRERRRALARDQWPLLLYAVAILGGIWVHQWYCNGSSSRYALTLVILGTRFAAPIWLRLTSQAAARLPDLFFGPQKQVAVIGLLTAFGWFDALSTRYDLRVGKAELGRWIGRTYGENGRVLGLDDQLPIVGHYAAVRPTYLPPLHDAEGLLRLIRSVDPDVLLISKPLLPEAVFQRISAARAELGLVPVESAQVRSDMLVLRRGTERR